jgi:ABC-type transport system substrate-binding protein
LLLPLHLAVQTLGAAPPAKALRTCFPNAETGFDPARITETCSQTVTAQIFEGLYACDPLARPAKIVPLTAAGLPEVSSDLRIWAVRLRPGIHFAAAAAPPTWCSPGSSAVAGRCSGMSGGIWWTSTRRSALTAD